MRYFVIAQSLCISQLPIENEILHSGRERVRNIKEIVMDCFFFSMLFDRETLYDAYPDFSYSYRFRNLFKAFDRFVNIFDSRKYEFHSDSVTHCVVALVCT